MTELFFLNFNSHFEAKKILKAKARGQSKTFTLEFSYHEAVYRCSELQVFKIFFIKI